MQDISHSNSFDMDEKDAKIFVSISCKIPSLGIFHFIWYNEWKIYSSFYALVSLDST